MTTTSARRLVALAATAALTTLTASGVLAPARAETPPGVTGADLPQVGRVDNIFPHLQGGRRELVPATHLDVPGRGECFLDGNGFRAQSVRWAFYPTSSGETAFFQGLEDPTWFVYQFGTRAKARQGFERIASYVSRCDRELTADDDSVTRRVEGVAVPRLGQRQLGFRTRDTYDDDVRRSVEVYVLQGRRIERSWIQLDDDTPSLPRAVRMARLVAETAR